MAVNFEHIKRQRPFSVEHNYIFTSFIKTQLHVSADKRPSSGCQHEISKESKL